MTVIYSSLVFLMVGYFFGFYVRTLWDKLRDVQGYITRRTKSEPPQSRLLEPELTPAERAVREQEELIERLNQA